MEHDVLELLTKLVAIDSVNPSLASGGAGERQIAAYVREWADQAGLATELLERAPGRPSVIVTGGADDDAVELVEHRRDVGTRPLTSHMAGAGCRFEGRAVRGGVRVGRSRSLRGASL